MPARKRVPVTAKPETPRELFAARLRELAGDKTAAKLAEEWGYSSDAILKFLRGDKTPEMNRWPDIAAACGLDSWLDLLPRKQAKKK